MTEQIESIGWTPRARVDLELALFHAVGEQMPPGHAWNLQHLVAQVKPVIEAHWVPVKDILAKMRGAEVMIASTPDESVRWAYEQIAKDMHSMVRGRSW